LAEHEIAPCHRHRVRRGQVLTGAVVLGLQHPRVLSGEVAVRVPPVEEVVLDPNTQVLALPGRVARVAVNDHGRGARSEERREGNKGGSRGRSRWWTLQ